MKLSILIASLTSREEMLNELLKELETQKSNAGLDEEVEILVLQDDGRYPIGMKRNRLVESASGLFVCFVDDDDLVAPTYVEDIYNAIVKNPDIDCVGLKGVITFNGYNGRAFTHSIRYKEYSQDIEGYYRPPNLLNPIRREIYKDYKFPERSYGEDTDVAMNMCRNEALKKEAFIDKFLYHYRYVPSQSEAAKYS